MTTLNSSLTINEITQLTGFVAGAGQTRPADKPAAIARFSKALVSRIGEAAAEHVSKLVLYPANYAAAEKLLQEAMDKADGKATPTKEATMVAKEKVKKEKAAKAAKKAKEPSEAGERGRKSAFSGKTIKPLVTENTRRAGSFGWKSMKVVLDNPKGISYEDYIVHGGRAVDLRWDIEHGNVEIK